MARIQTIKQANDHIGKTLYWDDHGSKMTIVRFGVLSSIYRRQICFDGSEDYKSINDFSGLRTTQTPS